ncbi:hypothetical protein [Streptomyces sp. NPDC059010]|uniref:hypothetical protein n=1 Tax=Streptomyces sp. NPDC059010 TaxID=3346695 RepID=UPI003673CFB9
MSRIDVDIGPGSGPPPRDDHALFGQPRGLLTASSDGMGMSAGTSVSVAPTPVAAPSVADDPLADRVAVPTAAMTRSDLGLISPGTGPLKPNAATMAGRLPLGLVQYAVGHRDLAGRQHAAADRPTVDRFGGLPFLLTALPTSGHSWDDYVMPLWPLSPTLATGIQAETVKLYDDASLPAYFAHPYVLPLRYGS